MLVIALKAGYHGKLREVGEKFDVPNGSKASWFQPVALDKASKQGGQSKGGDGDLV